MPRKSPYQIKLTPREKATLKKIARKYTSPYRDVIRARVVLYAVIIAPALQVLTTAFGGLITVLLTQQAVRRGN